MSNKTFTQNQKFSIMVVITWMSFGGIGMKKRFLAGLMAGLFVFTNISIGSQAANVVEVPAAQVDSVLGQQVDSNTLEGWPDGPQIYSESGIVMDTDTGAILYAKNIDDQHYPASITKVMTALVVFRMIEAGECQLTDKVIIKQEDISFLEYGDAHIGMKVGEEISLEDALYGMLLASANEVSHAIASSMEGGYDKFMERMNQTAAELGCENSHFVNTYGLHDGEHYTSARDMALISSAVFQYEKFREITNTYQHVIGKTNLVKQKRYVQQNHKMIRDWDSRYYEYCVGGKTGFTDQALTTLVTYATKGNKNLVAVTLRTHGGGNNAYADTKKILNYGFSKFQKVPVTLEQIENADLASVEENGYVMLPEGIAYEQLESVLTEPTELGDMEGTISYTYQKHPVGTIKVTITEEHYKKIHNIVDKKPEQPKKEKKTSVGSIIIKVLVGILVVAVVAVIALMGFVTYRRKKIEEARRERRRQRREEWATREGDE